MHHYATCLFLISSAVPTSKTSFQIATECTIKQPRFKKFLRSYNFQRIVLNTARKHQLGSLFSKESPQSQLPKPRFKQLKNAPFRVLDFKFFSAVPPHKTSLQVASECDAYVLGFNIFSAFPTFFEKDHFSYFEQTLFCPRYAPLHGCSQDG